MTAPRKQRLTRSADFDRVYRQGRSSQHRLLVMYRLEREEDVASDAVLDEELGVAGCRLGISISRRVGGAVERNRLKRQLREAAVAAGVLVPGSDLVLIARPGLAEAVEQHGFEWLMQLLHDVAQRFSAAS